MKKKKYIKPVSDVIMVHICCQMLSGSDSTLHHSDTQTDTLGPGVGGDDCSDGDLEAARINQWALENTVLNN